MKDEILFQCTNQMGGSKNTHAKTYWTSYLNQRFLGYSYALDLSPFKC